MRCPGSPRLKHLIGALESPPLGFFHPPAFWLLLPYGLPRSICFFPFLSTNSRECDDFSLILSSSMIRMQSTKSTNLRILWYLMSCLISSRRPFSNLTHFENSLASSLL